MVDSAGLAAIRARDDAAPSFWFSENNDSLLARAIQDRRYLLAELGRSTASAASADLAKLLSEVGTLRAENDKLRDDAFRLRQRLADLHTMPDGARRSECEECGYTFGTHAPHCSAQR
jgi:acetyl esterase/lipase